MNLSKTTFSKCFVPGCENTTSNSRHKVFVLVRETLKRRWCEELNMEYQPERRQLCCEDHLNLEDDLENFQYFKLMNGRPILKSNAKLRRNKLEPEPESTLKTLLLQPKENLQSSPSTSKAEIHIEHQANVPSLQSASTHTEKCTIAPETASTSVLKTLLQQAAEIEITEPERTMPTLTSASTHPIKIDAAVQCSPQTRDQTTSTTGLRQTRRTARLLSSSISSISQSVRSSETETMSSKDIQNHSTRNQILEIISENPKAYIGVPKQYFWLIKYICDKSDTKVTELDLCIVLFKIKLNDPAHRICRQFQISRVKFLQIMFKGVQVLANFFQNLIYLPTLHEIKRTQPLPFKIRYSNVQMILDAFEIQIQKPHNPTTHAQTWSQYKNANTIKYLVGSTPNGFICFISEGYSGRISDKALVEKSGLINILPTNSIIMADRGFKGIESMLISKNIKLLRPPSVFSAQKPTKEEVLQTKVLASLRAHIERIIRRIREFSILKPHSVVNHKHVGYLDYIVLIACGLINLQSKIMKSD